MNIQELADYAEQFFEQKTRPDGTRFWTLKDRHPTWLKDLVFKAHEDMLPDDYKYEYVVDALEALSEGDDPDSPRDEADVYNSDLLKWLSSHGERSGFVDEATKEFGHHPDLGIMGDIMYGQSAEKEQVWYSVVGSLNSRLEDIEMEVPEEFEKRGKKASRKDWDPREGS